MSKALNPLNEKCKKDNLKMHQIKNEDLQCHDCLYKLDDETKPCNTSKCEMFEMKPAKVLLNEGECDEYVKE